LLLLLLALRESKASPREALMRDRRDIFMHGMDVQQCHRGD